MHLLVPNQYFLPNQTDLSSVVLPPMQCHSVVLPAMKSLICRITCNEIRNLYYLQYNTQSYLLQYDIMSYYLQWNP